MYVIRYFVLSQFIITLSKGQFPPFQSVVFHLHLGARKFLHEQRLYYRLVLTQKYNLLTTYPNNSLMHSNKLNPTGPTTPYSDS